MYVYRKKKEWRRENLIYLTVFPNFLFFIPHTPDVCTKLRGGPETSQRALVLWCQGMMNMQKVGCIYLDGSGEGSNPVILSHDREPVVSFGFPVQYDARPNSTCRKRREYNL